MVKNILFEVDTPLGFSVRTTLDYWRVIINIKHPSMRGLEDEVKKILQQPDEIRQSRSDSKVHLYYKLQYPGRWLCAVVKRLNGDGFLITAYPTDGIKGGELAWNR